MREFFLKIFKLFIAICNTFECSYPQLWRDWTLTGPLFVPLISLSNTLLYTTAILFIYPVNSSYMCTSSQTGSPMATLASSLWLDLALPE